MLLGKDFIEFEGSRNKYLIKLLNSILRLKKD